LKFKNYFFKITYLKSFFCAHLSNFKCICVGFATSLLSVFVACPTVEVWQVLPPSIFLRATKTLRRLKWLTDWLLSKPSSSNFMILQNILRQKFARMHSPKTLREYFYRLIVSLTVKHSPRYRPQLIMKIETLKNEYKWNLREFYRNNVSDKSIKQLLKLYN